MANKRPRRSCQPQTTTTTTTKSKTTRRRCDGGTGITMLPDDVLSAIFTMLPARSILVLRLVCRSWRSLTSSAAFVLGHARRARATSVLLPSTRLNLYLLNHSKLAKRVVLENQTLPTELIEENYGKISQLPLLASCDGLLCFKGNPYGTSSYYLVCNILTKDCVRIPGLPDAAASLHAFYFHSPTGEYRLLQHCSNSTNTNGSMASSGYQVFSLGAENRVWRQIEASHGHMHWPNYLSLHAFLTQSRAQIASHGNLHWPPVPSYAWIIVFDTISEDFREMSVARLHRHHHMHVLIEMGESLGYCQLNWEQMEIWYLKDYAREDWVKKYTIPVHEIRRSMYKNSFHSCKPLALWNQGKEILLKFNNNCFLLYDLASKTFKKQKIYKFRETLHIWMPHKETLLSPNCTSK